jgi:hypothetical protein
MMNNKKELFSGLSYSPSVTSKVSSASQLLQRIVLPRAMHQFIVMNFSYPDIHCLAGGKDTPTS